jgi:hypothetical protein
MPLTPEQETLFQRTLGHEVLVAHVRIEIFNLTGLFPGGPAFPGSPPRMPVVGGPNLTDRVYGVLDAFLRSVAESCFAQSWTWTDFADGWRRRFANSACDDATAWGIEDQIGVAITALVDTGFMCSEMKQDLFLVRVQLENLVSHFIQALRMYMLQLEPNLLQMTEEEARDLMRRLYGDLQ